MSVGKPPVLRPCIVCGKSCTQTDRNSDGTYAHRECLYATSIRPGFSSTLPK